jgi:hypothetical protein
MSAWPSILRLARARGMTQIRAVESVRLAAYIEQLQKARSAPTAKLRLATLRR